LQDDAKHDSKILLIKKLACSINLSCCIDDSEAVTCEIPASYHIEIIKALSRSYLYAEIQLLPTEEKKDLRKASHQIALMVCIV
jgi:hypothetical protein